MASAVANRWRGIAGKCLVFGLALLPLGLLVADIVNANLGPDPGQVIAEALGIAAFQLLLVTLAITPLKKVTGWSGWLRYRRMLGLFAFFYAALHLLAFLQLIDRKSTRLNSSHVRISYAVFCLKKKKITA